MTEDQRRPIFEAENRGVPRPLGQPRDDRERVPDDLRTAELDTDLWVVAWDGDEIAGVVENWIWPEENERARRQARLARADQRPPPMAPARPGHGR